MLRHKHIDRVCILVMVLMLLVTTLFAAGAATGVITQDNTMGYEDRLFSQDRVHTIDIVMDDWDAFLDTCTQEIYADCTMVIDGEKYGNVAIRGKGNTSLSSVASYGNDRYSFKVEFDHYQSGMTYHGLDKLSLNNLIQDTTYMKDYWAYTLMNRMGVAAPLCSFVQINVNGEPWGLYLAVEGVEDSFLQRNYGSDHGELYKPDSMSFGGGRGNGRDFDFDEIKDQFGWDDSEGNTDETAVPTMPEGFSVPTMPDMGNMQMPGSSGESATTAPTTPDMGNMQMPGSSGESASTAPTMPDMGNMQMPGSSGESASTAPTMPDMGNMQMPGNSGESATTAPMMPDMGNMQMPGSSGESASTAPMMPDMGNMQMPGSSGESASTAPTMPDMGNMQMPGATGGSTPTVPTIPEGLQMPEGFTMPEGMEMPEMPDMGGFGGFGMGSGDVKLVYSDDDPASYENIFNNAKTDISDADQARLIAAIKAMNEGDTSAVDTEAVIRYLAVHAFLCNDDSYTGMMVHNYYLYEEDGVLSMIPWDYNLAMGGFQGGSNATSTVNSDIMSPVTSGSVSDRPMVAWIFDGGEYEAAYAETVQRFIDETFTFGWFETEFDRVRAMIAPYVQADSNGFFTYDEFVTGADALREFCLLRAEAIGHQLDGSDTRVDASHVNLSAMGGMNAGKGGFGGEFGSGKDSMRNRGSADAGETASDDGTKSRGSRFQQAFATPAQSGETDAPASETATPSNERFGNGERQQASAAPAQSGETDAPASETATPSSERFGNGERQQASAAPAQSGETSSPGSERSIPFGMMGQPENVTATGVSTENPILLIASVVVLAGALCFAIGYRKQP